MIFVDTSFFVALLDPRDKNHARAKAAFEEFAGRRLSDRHRFVIRPGPRSG